jgi:hypothetical protein
VAFDCRDAFGVDMVIWAAFVGFGAFFAFCVLAVFVPSVRAVFIARKGDEADPKTPWFLGILALVLIAAYCAVAVGGICKGINLLLYHLPGKYENWIACLVFPLGYIAHNFKKVKLFYYGVSEVLVGVGGAFGVTLNQRFGPVQGLAIMSAIYLVARGFNNISDAREKGKATSAQDPPVTTSTS